MKYLLTVLFTALLCTCYSHNLENLTDYSFKNDKFAVIQFSADWCGWCQKEYPVMEKIQNDSNFSDVNFYVLDVDECPDIKNDYDVRSLPTLFFFKSG